MNIGILCYVKESFHIVEYCITYGADQYRLIKSVKNVNKLELYEFYCFSVACSHRGFVAISKKCCSESVEHRRPNMAPIICRKLIHRLLATFSNIFHSAIRKVSTLLCRLRKDGRKSINE